MLTEIWERLRGYDKWPQTEAKIESSKLEEVVVEERYGKASRRAWQSTCVLGWEDSSGQAQRAEYSVMEDSPLFQLYEGQAVSIRYDPAHPGKYYFRDLLRSQVMRALKQTMFALLLIAAFVLVEWLR